MSFLSSFFKDASQKAGTILGDQASQNMHTATAEAIKGMDAFKAKAAAPVVRNADYSTGRGFLFEYIETAKFNREAAIKGFTARAFTTDALGDPGAAADILIKDGGKTVKEIQAKFTDRASNAVYDQAGMQRGHWGKYHGMDRLIRKDEAYNDQGSMLDEARKLAKQRSESGSIYAEEYRDVYEHLTDETHYKGVSSGGTTQEELKSAFANPEKYAKAFERKQLRADMRATSKNMAASAAVTSGIASGVSNFFAVFTDGKELAEAIGDVTKDVARGAVRGGITGSLSTAIRYKGLKKGNALLSDSTTATVMAGGIIDGGVALYEYAKGDIDSEELVQQLTDTTVKSVSTVYFTKATEAALGTANPFLPIAVYTVASYVVSTTREIIKNAELNAEEYARLEAIYLDSARELQERHQQLLENISAYRENQQRIMTGFLNSFDYNMETGENYEHALYAIVNFANQTGMALQHADFNEFKAAMNSDEVFVLGRR